MSFQRKQLYRRRRFWAAAIIVLVAYLIIRLVNSGGPPAPPRAGISKPAVAGDPFAYNAAAASEFVKRVTVAESQVLFTKSPGGVMATAARVAQYRPLINMAVRGTNIPPALLEGLVFVESAGRADVMAGHSVADAVGLTQILAETGTAMLSMHIDTKRSAKLTKEITTAQAEGNKKQAAKLETQRAKADPRFDPATELAATVRYLRKAENALGGRADLAVAAYHAGIGNIQQVLDSYDGGRAVPYAKLYFSVSPSSHPATLQQLEDLTDDGSLYYWRILGAERIMYLWRHNRTELSQWAAQAGGYPTNALVLLGLTPASKGAVTGTVPVFSDPDAVANAYWTKPKPELVPLPRNGAQLHLSYAKTMGDLADKLGAPPGIYRGLRPVALRMLIQMAAWVDQIAGSSAPLTVASTVQDAKYNTLVGLGDDPPGATGYTFQIARSYANEAQREAFQFVLDRLQDLNLITWLRYAKTIEITVSPDAGPVLAHGI